jgi:hypothetical protein
MITLSDAQEIAQNHLEVVYKGQPYRVVLLPEHTRLVELGWLFFYNTEAYARSQNLNDGLLGNSPLFVDARTGAIHAVPHPVEESLARYKQTGSMNLPNPASDSGTDS